MTEAEFRQWLPGQTRDYAQGKVDAGNWPADTALALAAAQMLELLPEGLMSANHRLWSVEDAATGAVVGSLWVHLKESTQGAFAFIYNIEMVEAQRGRGYGTATLKALEAEMRREGAVRIALHVFGHNTGARRLYERMGYEITNINMAKTL